MDATRTPGLEGRIKEVIVDTRIKKVLGMRTESTTMLEALEAINDFYGKTYTVSSSLGCGAFNLYSASTTQGNTANARKSLRHDLESQNIMLARRFLDEYEQVKLRLEAAEQQVSGRLSALWLSAVVRSYVEWQQSSKKNVLRSYHISQTLTAT
jgi:hypothetical protein